MIFQTIKVLLDGAVATIELNRPDKANAINLTMWQEFREAMRWLDETPAARVGIISGVGKHFTAGIDLALLASLRDMAKNDCAGRMREKLRRIILNLQDTLSSIEQCRKPVIAAIHGACVGGGIDMITACDLRFCSTDAYFSVKEIDVGLTADLGTLQRLPRLIGEGMARELAYTGRRMTGAEAQATHLVNRCYPSQTEMMTAVRDLAGVIASKSPLAMRGTKEMISYTRDHSVADGLNYVATWNAAMLFSSDLEEAMLSAREGRPPKYPD